MSADWVPSLDEQRATLDAMTDDDIDYSDIPPIKDLSNAVMGKFYRPKKESVTIRLDADLLAWFKANYPKYQTEINKVLRNFAQTRTTLL